MSNKFKGKDNIPTLQKILKALSCKSKNLNAFTDTIKINISN